MKKHIFFSSVLLAMFSIYYFNNDVSDDLTIKSKQTSTVKKFEKKAASFKESLKWRNELLRNVETGKIESIDYYNAIRFADLQKSNNSNKTDGLLNLEWVNKGPDSQAGRTRAVLFDQDDPKVIYAGSSSGGLYKSIDRAENWERVSSYGGNNATVMSLAQSVNGTLFLGTGEFIVTPLGIDPDGFLYRSNFTGDGIFKSSDNGDTWSHINATNVNSVVETSAGTTIPTDNDDWAIVSSLATHPTNSNLLIAGTKSGIKISIDAEASQPNFTSISSVNGEVSDVKFTSDGESVWAAIDGVIYFSNDQANDFNSWSLNSPSISGATRAQIAISTVDDNDDYIIYTSMTDGDGCLLAVFKSDDKGINWTQIAYAGGLDPFAQPTGSANSGCQGWYDHCIAVNPVDKNKIYIGGITFYSLGSGGLKRADQIGSEFAESLDPDFLHADKHTIVFSPHDPSGNTMLIGHDGGLSMCLNANSGFPDNFVFSENNKNYITLQCYSIGSGKYGEVIAGAQDNGTQYVDYKGISPKAAIEVSGGDGVGGAEISNFDLDIIFSGYVFGALYRSFNNGDSYHRFLDENIDPADCGHITCLDFLSGEEENCDNKKDEGQEFIYPFYLMETYDRKTPRNNLYIKAQKEDIILPSGIIKEFRDTIQPGDVTNKVELEMIPGMDFSNLDINFELDHVLLPGEIDSFENKFDAKYFVPTKCGTNFFVCMNPLQNGVSPKFNSVSIPNQSSIVRMDASNNGDILVGVGGSNVIIMKGWDAYDPDTNPNAVSSRSIDLTPIGGSNIVGVSVSKTDTNHVLVTEAGYGGNEKVFVSYNAATNNPTFQEIHNNLPEMPIYCCVIDKANSQRYILGTELGIWSSNDGGLNWFEENEGMGGRFPVYALRQEWMNNFECYVISAGTFGAGMYTTTTLMECANKNELIWGRPISTPITDIVKLDLKIYPNPVKSIAKIEFDLQTKADVTIQIYDVTGQIVYDNNLGFRKLGKQETDVNLSNLSKGAYFVILKDESSVLAKTKLIKN